MVVSLYKTAYIILYKQGGIIYCCPFFALDCKIRMKLTGHQVVRDIFRLSHILRKKSNTLKVERECMTEWILTFNPEFHVTRIKIHISSFH